MNPAHGWNEADYYVARNNARRAWEQSEPQYVIPGLDELDSGEVERAASSRQAPAAAAASSVSSPPRSTTTEGAAT